MTVADRERGIHLKMIRAQKRIKAQSQFKCANENITFDGKFSVSKGFRTCFQSKENNIRCKKTCFD